MMRRSFFLVVCLASVAQGATRVNHYLGEVRVLSPDGIKQSSSVSLAKRTLDPKSKAIVEQITHVPARGAPESHVNVIKIDGDSFTLRDAGGKIHGRGKLTGKPWQWKLLEGTSEIENGKGYVHAREQFTATEWKVKREFFDEKGRLKWIYSEDRKIISEAMYDILAAKLLPSNT